MKKLIELIFAGALLQLVTAHIVLADITVNTSGDSSLLDPDDGQCTLREAINNANRAANDPDRSMDCDPGSATATDPDTIVFSVSTVNLSDGVGKGEISIISDVTIKGPVTISGQNQTRHFVLGGSDSKLRITSGSSLEDGNDASGGSILVNSVSALLTCDNSAFKNNTAENDGGAIYSSGTLSINACTFEGNKAGNDGGAIHKNSGTLNAATLTITAGNFTDNHAGTDADEGGEGGAIYFTTSLANIVGSRFNNNSATSGGNTDNRGGGAIRNTGSGFMNISGSAFAGNKVNAGNQTASKKWHGGAIHNTAFMALTYSHFGKTPLPLPPPFNTLTTANQVLTDEGMGGAIYNSNALLVVGSSFIGNAAFQGGALANNTTSDSAFVSLTEFAGATIANSMFSDNEAADKGGAIYNFKEDALIRLINATVANNVASTGGGIYSEGVGDDGDIIHDEFLLENSIIANNIAGSGANCGGATTSSEGFNNIVFPASADCPNSPALLMDPMLGTPTLGLSIPNFLNYTLPLETGSAALGAGSAMVCAAFPVSNIDQGGFIRPQGDVSCDAGAYESSLVGMLSPTPTASPSSTPTETPVAPTATVTGTPTETPVTPTPTVSSTPTQTLAAPTTTATATATETQADPTATATQTQTQTNTPLISVSATPTNTPVTPTFTATSTNTAAATNTPTATSTGTISVTSTATSTTSATSTSTPTATGSQSPTPTGNITATATATISAASTTPAGQTTVPAEPTIDSSTDLGCTSTNIQDKQFALDGAAARQRFIIQRVRAQALKAGAEGRDKVKLDKIFQSATSAYNRMWGGIWSYRSVINQCTNTVFCTSVDISETSAAFKKDSDLMGSLLDDALKIYRKVKADRKTGKTYKKQMKQLQRSNESLIASIPATESVCNNNS